MFYRSDFRESTDGRAIVATFELPEVAKEDIHVSFQRNRLVLAWETRELYEWEEDGVVLRELIRTVHHRTLPLPEGTRVRGMTSCLYSITDSVFQVPRDTSTNVRQRVDTQISEYAMLSGRWSVTID